MRNNLILTADSYKYSMFNQYPEGTEYVYSYIESRGGEFDATVFVGLQAFLKEYLLKPITKEDIDEAEDIVTAHGEPFYREGWDYILETYYGRLPVQILAVPEGTILPTKNILVSIINTDPKCFWLTTVLETALLRAVWYPITVATNSLESKKIILDYLEATGSPESIDFKLHDFGARGVSSLESAALGGLGHLTSFKGTDNVAALQYIRRYYGGAGAKTAGFSIPAMEHSTVTSWGRENEYDSYRNMLKQYAKPGAIVACVSDAYNIYEACEAWGTVLKDDVINSGATIVIRPDSGYPPDVVLKCLQILDKNFGHIVNEKGYRVLNHVRVIQGDGITKEMIRTILAVMRMNGYSADNIAFGQGGAMLQIVNRDDFKFAMKCSAVGIRNKETRELEWRDVFKDPVDDAGKASKRGMLALVRVDGQYKTVRQDWDTKDQMAIVFMNGMIMNDYTWDEVLANMQQ